MPGTLKLKSEAGGSVILAANTTAVSDYTVTVPPVADTMALVGATQTLTNKTIGSGYGGGVITSGTAQASTSGTAITFTGIPSWVKRITVMFSGVRTSGTSPLRIRLGTSGGIVSSGYLGVAEVIGNGINGSNNPTDGFGTYDSASTCIWHGLSTSCLLNSATNIWCNTTLLGRSESNYYEPYSGSVTLSSVLTQISITPSNGTDTFTAGSINILYE
jgi:hypothetical protein